MGTKGTFNMEVERELSPIGVDHFHSLVESGHFDGASFFRMVKGFVVQFGLSGDPAVTAETMKKTILDDPVKASNKAGTVTYAKSMMPNSRSTQLFINLGDNAFLDDHGLAVIDALEDKYGEAPDQGAIMQQGDAYLKSTFPDLDHVIKARVL